MSGRLFIFGLALLVFQFTVVQGQSTSQGFLNIACGLPKDQGYNDSRGLPYISDSEFIDTGESAVVSSELFVVNSTVNNLRRFPNGTRNCYKVEPVLERWTYLVRARFKYGNYDGRNNFPQFDLYLGINYWGTLSKDADLEIMVVTVSNFISICLVNTNQGIPFVSAIELRPLTDTLYSEANTSQSLVLLNRRNLGGGLFSYPEDIYDRIWLSDKSGSLFPAVETYSTSFAVVTSSFAEPSIVMKSIVYPADQTATSLNSTVSVTSMGACPSTRAYFVFYFAEIEYSSEVRRLHVSVDDLVISEDISLGYRNTVTSKKSVPFNGNQLTFSIASVSGSTQPPFLNALEIYRIIDMTCQSETRSHDVEAMMDVKSHYKVQRNWNGDPCAPKAYMWEGLNCSYNGSSSPLITFLNLSSSGLTGEILASLGNLSAMQYLDLSSNSLTGDIPDSLSRLTQLKVLNLANNNLTGSIPKVLLSMSTNGQLNLTTDGNTNLCSNLDSCQGNSSKKNNKVMLILVISCVVVAVLMVVVVSIVVRKACRDKPRLEYHKPKKFTHLEIEGITENYKKKIGEGGYGKVYRGKHRQGVQVQQVAVKTLLEDKLSKSGVKGFQAEVSTLTTVRHKNLVKFIGYCDDDIQHVALVYEYMEGGSLQEQLSGEDKRKELSWRKRLRIAFDVAEGLKYLHKDCVPPIIHRDIKPGNILLTKDLEARIGDFGLSKIYKNDSVYAPQMPAMGVGGTQDPAIVETNATPSHMLVTAAAGTQGYLDPEYVKTHELRDKSDVYSFGVVLMVLITGLSETVTDIRKRTPIADWIRERLSRNEIEKIIDETIKEEYDENSVLGFAKIAEECARKNHQERPDITKVVKGLDELRTAYDKSHPPTSDNPQEQPQADVVDVSDNPQEQPQADVVDVSDNPQEQPQADVVGSHGEEGDDVPLRQSSEQSHSYSKSNGHWKILKRIFFQRTKVQR